MLKKSLFLAIVVISSAFWISTSHAGGAAPLLTINASTPTAITAGQSVTFSVTYNCLGSVWTSATLQLFTGPEPITLNNQIADALTIQGVPDIANVVPDVTTSMTATFNQVGTFEVHVNARQVSGPTQGAMGWCELSSVSSVTVTVAAAATTTTATPTTTTTVASTTTATEKEVLPATGPDNSNALIAVGVALAGAVVLMSRRRLLTK